MIDIALDWYQSLVDDITAIHTEGIFTARWEVIKCYHGIGERIVTDADYQRYANGNGKLLAELSQRVNIAERDLYRAVQFYAMFPNLDLLPDGKNISWHKICNNLLPAGDAKGMRARTYQQWKASFKNQLVKALDEYDDMEPDIKRRVLELLALFDEKFYDTV